jgi:uncharacterized phage protein gp47/JayE
MIYGGPKLPFDRPTLKEINDRKEADLNASVENSTTFLRRSVFKVLSKVNSGGEYTIYDYLNWIKDQIFITSADAEILEIHGGEYGISRDFGNKATGTATASGTVGTSISAGAELQSSSNNVYRVNATTAIGAGGTVSIDFTAVEADSDYNEDGLVSLSFVSPIPGVNTTVTVTAAGITGGEDEETVEEYRARILDRKRQPPHGGASFDYEKWAKEVAGVTRAWSIDQYQGAGTIGLVFVQDGNDDIFPDQSDRDAVESYIISHTDPSTGLTVGIPVTAEPGFYVIDASAYTVDFSIEIYPETDAVKTAVTNSLNDLILERGGPGQTIYISEMYNAIASSLGEVKSRILVPADDVTAPIDRVHVMGNISWSSYNG